MKLERVYASGGPEVIIPTLELTCEAWDEPILVCAGFENQTCVTEDARTLTFIAVGMSASLPKVGNSGGQNITTAIDNVLGIAQEKIDTALDAEQRIRQVYRTYLSSDLSGPAEPPYYMTVLGGTTTGTQVQIDAGYFDLINVGWPRDLYTLQFAPGLRYL